MSADITTLSKLADKLEMDARALNGLNPSAMASIAFIIRDAIGAPLMWPSRVAGADAASDYYPGHPDLRHGFNAGVKWAVEHYHPTIKVEPRFR
jgi:hypothetical protein